MTNEIEIAENVILVRINKLFEEDMTKEQMYEATRGIWRIGSRKEKADYAFAVYKGEVKEVYKIVSWFPACTLTYNTRAMRDAISNVDRKDRWEFDGVIAEDGLRKKYIGKSVKNYFPWGASNPVMYVNC